MEIALFAATGFALTWGRYLAGEALMAYRRSRANYR